MVLKRLLKGIFKNGEEEKSLNLPTEEISYSNLETEFEKKKSEISAEERRLIEEIISNLGSFKQEALNKVNSLEQIDVYSSKIQDKAKDVIKENLDNYVSLYKEFFESLVSLRANSLSLLLSKIDGLLKDFEKRSYKNYQKVAFLFENKIREANAEVIKVSDYLKKVSRDNSSLVWKSESFYNINSKFQEIHDLREKAGKSDESLRGFDEKVEEKEQEMKSLREKIDSVKLSEAYKNNLEKEKQVKSKIEEIDSQIDKLKKSIDFKSLGDAFHKDPHKIQLVKSHKDNFVRTFKGDWGESLEILLNPLGKNDLISRIHDIRDRRQELLDLQNSFEKTGIEKLESDLESARLRVEDLSSEKEKEKKNRKKFLDKIEELEGEIVNSLKQAGYRIVE